MRRNRGRIFRKSMLTVSILICFMLMVPACNKDNQQHEYVIAQGTADLEAPTSIFAACDGIDDQFTITYPENFIFEGTIQRIDTSSESTPALIVPNGCMGILFHTDGMGWLCSKGDVLKWSFEKANRTQTIGIGYIFNGMVSEPSILNESAASYQVEIQEPGEYHIYFIGASSDPVFIKEGKIYIE